MMTNVIDSKQGTDAVGARELRNIAENAIRDLLSSGESVDLRRSSRLVFEDKCLDEVLWESFVDEWIEAAYGLAGEATNVLDYRELTDWCVCGHSNADHRLDCQNSECDCERYKRARTVKRPKQRKASKFALAQKAARFAAPLRSAFAIPLGGGLGRDISYEKLTGGAL